VWFQHLSVRWKRDGSEFLLLTKSLKRLLDSGAQELQGLD
jgi:hypothetical protein